MRYASKPEQLTLVDFQNVLLHSDYKYSTLVLDRQKRYDQFQITDQTVKLIRDLFVELIDCEEQVEAIRQYLNKTKVFDLEEAFSVFDRCGFGFLTGERIQNELMEENFKVSKEEVIHLMKRYDRDHDGVVSFNEFRNELVPKHNI